MRDITLADTFYATFTTRAFATGIPTTLAGTPVVSAYENDSLTQITAGITLGVDHDSVTGLNLLTVVATGANGYENGKDYSLVITTGTVSSVSVVGEVVAEFSIGRSAAAVDLANATDGLGAIKAETAAILNDTDLIDDGTSGLAKIATDVAAVLVDTADIQPNYATSTALATVDANVDAILVDTSTTLQAELDGIQADTEDIQSRIPAALSTDGHINANVEAINDDATTAAAFEALMDGALLAQVNDASATTTAFAADGFTEATDDHFNGRLITFVSGALRYQQTDITDYDAAGGAQGSQQFTVTALTEAPANNDFFLVH